MKIISVIFLVTMLLSSCGTAENTSTQSSDLYSIDNKGSGWGFKKNKDAPPDIPAEISDMLSAYDSFYMDTSGEKVLYLTFDEGYENGYTAQILDITKWFKPLIILLYNNSRNT